MRLELTLVNDYKESRGQSFRMRLRKSLATEIAHKIEQSGKLICTRSNPGLNYASGMLLLQRPQQGKF